LEDVLPVPSGRPTKITFPGLSADQSWAKSNEHFTGRKSGCTVCHESVRVDNWSKTSIKGKLSVGVNGSAIGSNGIAKDWAIRSINGN
jgi:hypothetical protein